jgi:molecular chaperone GrpE
MGESAIQEQKVEKNQQEDEQLLENTLEVENANLKDQLLRNLAETDNLRKRFQKEKEDILKYSTSSMAKDLLIIPDNFERTLKAIIDIKNEDNQTIDKLVEGIELISKELDKIFARHGITKLETNGQKFDPNFHQAVVEVDTQDQDSGIIVETFQNGYIIHDRLLRPAMVSVSKKK